MGGEHSKERSVYESVRRRDVESIRSLHRQGAALLFSWVSSQPVVWVQWRSFSGKTPLILACSEANLLPVAKVLLDLGADVNDYDPEYGVGTALHRAAKRGLEQTAILLLSHGGNILFVCFISIGIKRLDELHLIIDCNKFSLPHAPRCFRWKSNKPTSQKVFNFQNSQTSLLTANPLLPNCFHRNSLDHAREAGHTGIVRAIESHICFFSGWLRETYHFSNPHHVLTSLRSPRRTWAVVLPSDPILPRNLTGLKLALYRDRQSPRPFKVVSLKKFILEEPVFSFPDPELVLIDKYSSMVLKLLSGEEGDKEQLKLLYHTCRGVLEPNKPSFQRTARTTTTVPPWLPGAGPVAPAVAASAPSSSQEDAEIAMAIVASIQSAVEEGIPLSAVSFGSPENREGCGNVHYPPVDSSPVDVIPTTFVEVPLAPAGEGTSGSGSSCVICVDAPVEAACVPCGHMAGCMACLNEVKMKEFGCPVCRADIERIMKIYTV
ncbi:unnamed protein product [Spirodela intermedia]|uniref:RING-type domain-containing protein n=1 Tax=Spirodela intermedia TaxID=51605 RepID=A0A7I8KM78_SPIIN|nr:unnamed protein product [Spirodela intermedia]